jgi:ectoine hydroxylase-related dioxygenase (phytanoyl-CoA dioxygenase family)
MQANCVYDLSSLNIPQFKNNEDSAYDFYMKNGFHIEDGIFDESDCQKLIEESHEFENFKNKSYIPEQQIHQENENILSMMSNDSIKNIINKFAAKGKEMFGIQSTFFYGVPGTSGSSSHQDGLWVQPEDSNGFISAWTPLVDLENDNMGNLYVYESSHKDGSLDVRENKDLKSEYQNKGLVKFESVLKKNLPKHKIIIKKGSTVFLHSNVVHGSVPNDSKIDRNVVLFTYIRDGLNFREGREAKRVKTKLK